MRTKFNNILMLIVAVLLGCKHPSDQAVTEAPPPGLYSYTGFDTQGKPVVVGTFSLAFGKDGAVSGEWVFEKSGSGEVGPQVGTGRLEGRLEKNEIKINLNPGWADNNVFLDGKFEGGTIKGKWTWVTFRGPTTEGTFEATPKQ